MNYLVSNNGLSLRSVDTGYQAQTGEVLFDHVPTPTELTSAFTGYAAATNQESIKAQIAALEATQTRRRIREAQAGTDGGWLTNLNTQIAALRAQLN